MQLKFAKEDLWSVAGALVTFPILMTFVHHWLETSWSILLVLWGVMIFWSAATILWRAARRAPHP